MRHTFDVGEAVRELKFNSSIAGIVEFVVVDVGYTIKFLKDDTEHIIAVGGLKKRGECQGMSIYKCHTPDRPGAETTKYACGRLHLAK